MFRGFVLGYIIFFCNFFGSIEINRSEYRLDAPPQLKSGDHSVLSHS
jgi:hypothetical protein